MKTAGAVSVVAERQRLEAQRQGSENWRLWGPYLAERAWGTVREDYSPHGNAWESFDHDQARSRAYRWNEDGMAGICDEEQRLCLALAFWNGRDPILKERAFGLTGNQGNHGEDVKEYYFYLDATPSHSYLRYLYKYPQAEYPYARLVSENRRRSRHEPPYALLDTDVFGEDRYWDIEVEYAKATPDCVHARITAHNRGADGATLHLLPTLWFRNTWGWDESAGARPLLQAIPAPRGAQWAVAAVHETLGGYYLYGRETAEPLFTDNESNGERLWSVPGASRYVKDAFHRRVVDNDPRAVNPAGRGTKFAAWHRLGMEGGGSRTVEIILSARSLPSPFARNCNVVSVRRAEADAFYAELLPDAPEEDARIVRQALAGIIWSKQFFHYDVLRWLQGDRIAPPSERRRGRNRAWQHLRAHDVISMPDKWEYPWFAAWDLAYHCAALALVDIDFAKEQIELVLRETYLHPNGQIPAYEWAFGDANPPVHAMGALKVFRAERVQRGEGDRNFLRRVFHKLLINYAWWINRKDRDGHNVFEGGFLGLDNISVFDRSQPLPPGHSLKQADATGWMAMFALNVTVMALELATEDPDYEDVAIQTFEQFLAIANAIAGYSGGALSLWDEEKGFFQDLLVTPDGRCHHIDVYSWVGLIPLFAVEVVDERLLANVPRFRRLLESHAGGRFRGHCVSACPHTVNARQEHIFSLVTAAQLRRILARLLSEEEFLSPYGVRSVSRRHATHRDLGVLPGVGQALIEYIPGESTSGLFGGNSNWRGPVWMPTNYTLVQALEKFHRYHGEDFRVPVPALGGRELNLQEIASLLCDRLVNLYRRNAAGRIAAYAADSPFQDRTHWKDLLLMFEYFHGDTGQGVGASHQTGWTGLIANLVLHQHRRDIPLFWREQDRRLRSAA